MDTRIGDGDYAVTAQGYPIVINGIQEAVQRARFVLTVLKGTFIYDRDMGISRDCLELEEGDESGEMVTMLCREALADRDDLYVTDAHIYFNEFYPRIVFTVHYGGQAIETEVHLNTHV